MQVPCDAPTKRNVFEIGSQVALFAYCVSVSMEAQPAVAVLATTGPPALLKFPIPVSSANVPGCIDAASRESEFPPVVCTGVGVGIGVGVGVRVGLGATYLVKKSSADQPSIPESKLIFHQLNPPEFIGPPTTVPNAPVDCVPNNVPLAAARTFKGPLDTWTLSLIENLVDGAGVGVMVGVRVRVGAGVGVGADTIPDGSAILFLEIIKSSYQV